MNSTETDLLPKEFGLLNKRRKDCRLAKHRGVWTAFFLFPFSFFLFTAPAQSTNDSSANEPAPTDFSTFQIIVERNIFNPDRYARTGHHYESHSVPTFSLAGTMSYRKGMFAFFDGTRDEYREALQEGGKIAGYTVAKINFDGVELQSSGKTIDMKVGAAMQRQGDVWELSAPGTWGNISTSETGSETDTNAATSTNAAPSSAEENDVLKRLMEKREQELK